MIGYTGGRTLYFRQGAAMEKKKKKDELVLVDLALQGGGSHGAFTWGVLDRLLEEPDIHIEGISGTSAGSMNAAVMASGFLKDGAAGAREALDAFWSRIAEAATYSPFQRSWWDRLLGQWSLDHSPLFIAYDLFSRLFSPYDLNSVAFNPLRDILLESIDFEGLRQAPTKLFITATNVHTGRGRIFDNEEITAEVLLASACLPSLYQAVDIDGEAYWDGGFSGNPSITPLVCRCTSHDTILVQINPVERLGTPRSAREIQNRLNEVAFNAPLLKELRMIALLRQEDISSGGECGRWARMRIHRIASDEMVHLGASSKMNAEWDFLTLLRDEGRRTTEAFLKKHKKDLRHRSSFDLDALL